MLYWYKTIICNGLEWRAQKQPYAYMEIVYYRGDRCNWDGLRDCSINKAKDLNSHSNLEKEEQNWKYHDTWYQTIQQGESNQNSTVLP